MIRELRSEDIKEVADIWLAVNLAAHNFVPPQYWQSHIRSVKEQLLEAEVYVYEDKGTIMGFIGLDGDYIQGIFVSADWQSQGIGALLLNYVKSQKEHLHLHVYQKNTRAIHFYQREGFAIRCEGLDEATGERDYAMEWSGR